MAEWQPIETAPRDGTVVDLWVQHEDGGERFANMRYRDGGAGESNDWDDVEGFFSLVGDGLMRMEQVTHWMPLPEPPND